MFLFLMRRSASIWLKGVSREASKPVERALARGHCIQRSFRSIRCAMSAMSLVRFPMCAHVLQVACVSEKKRDKVQPVPSPSARILGNPPTWVFGQCRHLKDDGGIVQENVLRLSQKPHDVLEGSFGCLLRLRPRGGERVRN